jgi:hypothetical protein
MLTTLKVIAVAYLLVGSFMAARSMRQIYSPDRYRWRLEILGLSSFEAQRRAQFFASPYGFLRLFVWAQFGWPVVAGAVAVDRWHERQLRKKERAQGESRKAVLGEPNDGTIQETQQGGT